MDTIGPISRTVEDCALTIQTIAGHDPKDPYTWNCPVPDYRRALDGNIRGLKVGVITDLLYSETVDSEVREAVVKATSVLGDLETEVEEVSIPLAVHAQTISSGLRVEAPVTYGELLRSRLREIGHDNRIGYLVGSILPAQAYYKAQKLRVMLRQQVLAALERFDVLVLPTSASAAPKVEPDPVIDSKEKAFRNSASLTPIFSLASTPALSINCGFTSQGLPIGLQIGGRLFDEETLLKVAYAYEQSTPWHERKPPI
jgi:aspartyl-tRNA(Asn)/glutamyl-tRNA(Gln) amidotransferase subunit A